MIVRGPELAGNAAMRANYTDMLTAAEMAGNAKVWDEVQMAAENCPASDKGAVMAIQARLDDGTISGETARIFKLLGF